MIRPEYLPFRCCMCLNTNQNTNICLGIPGTPHPHTSQCRFVKCYVDERGWKYKVMSGIGENRFKARYQKPDKTGDYGWKGLATVPWRDTFDEAQTDLNMLAEKKGWNEWEE